MGLDQEPSLPTEILSPICAFATLADLKSIRLASKRLESCASRFLFETIYIDILLDSFEKLLAISKQPRLSKNVRSVFFQLRLFGQGIRFGKFMRENQETWNERRRDRVVRFNFEDGNVHNNEISDEKWRQHARTSMAMQKQQIRVGSHSTILVILFQAFSRFPRLHELFAGDLRYLPVTADSGTHDGSR